MALLRQTIQTAFLHNHTNSKCTNKTLHLHDSRSIHCQQSNPTSQFSIVHPLALAAAIFGTPSANRTIKRWVAPTLRAIKRRKDKMGPEPLPNRTTFIEWNYTSELFAFGKRLNESFNPVLLQQAFTHRSYIVKEELKQQEVGIEQPTTNLTDNKPLMQTGQQLISKYVHTFLTAHLPKFPHEGIQSVHDYLLSDEVLANVSAHIGTRELTLTAEFPPEPATLAGTFKAVVGALATSSGEPQAFDFVRDFVCTQLNQKDVNELWPIDDPVARLQSVCRERNLGEPEPRLIGHAGKNTVLAVKHVGIYCDRRILAEGFGENVSTAIEVAARHSLARLFATDNVPPFDYKIAAIDLFKAAAGNRQKLIGKV